MSPAAREDEEEAAALLARAEASWECVTVGMLLKYAPSNPMRAPEVATVMRGLAIMAYLAAAKDGKEPPVGG